MKNSVKYLLCALFLCFGILYAEGGPGTATGSFLKIGSSARGAAMGDAYSALCEDASAVYYNPAGLNYTGNLGFTFMHAIWFEGVSCESLGVNLNLPNFGKVGLGVQYLAVGSMPGADALGISTGDFFPGDLAISLSYAMNMSGYDLGVTAKYISLTVTKSASTFALDLGAIKKINISGTNAAVSFTARNIGLPVSFGSVSEGLPGSINLGIALDPLRDLTVSAEACLPWDNSLFVMAGAEYKLDAGDFDFKIRAGYNARTAQAGELGGLTAGFGAISGDYALDYAFIPLGNLGYTHRISVSVVFEKKNNAPVKQQRKFNTKTPEK